MMKRKPTNKVEMDRIPLRERKKQRVTERIISAASELFKTCGYHPTTMDDIADKAEISRATLFNYFPTKEALLLPWGQEIMEEQILPRLRKTMKSQSTVWQVFQFLFTNMNEIQREYPDVIQALVQEAVKEYHSGPISSERMGPHEVYIQVIRYGQERGELRTDLPMENLVSYLSALQMSLFFRIMDPKLAKNSSLEINPLMTFLERGLREEKRLA
jgi:AcrR family transcriptional regulator